ncbi:hypothetical protein VTO73DRAFT_11218 [Trametes versicolor]
MRRASTHRHPTLQTNPPAPRPLVHSAVNGGFCTVHHLVANTERHMLLHHIEITRSPRTEAGSDFQDHSFRLFPIGQRWKAQWLHHGFAGVMSARRRTLRAPKPGRALRDA